MSARTPILAIGLIATITGGAMAGDLPIIDSQADLEAHAGKPARIEGRYEVSPVAGSKRLQPAVIVLSDGTQLIRSYRPVPAEFGLLDRKVVVFGKAYLDANQGPDVQQVMAPHVFPETIELASGEKAIEPLPPELPPPPKVTQAADFERHAGRYVRLVATFKELKPLPDESSWADAVYALADGSQVQHSGVSVNRFKPHVGKLVSVVARAGLVEIDGQRELLLTDLSEICAGDVERCGIPATRKPGAPYDGPKKIGGPPRP